MQTFRYKCAVKAENNQTNGAGKEEDEEQPCHSLHGVFTRESSLHLKRKHCNLYSSAAGDWLTFTSPVERRKRGGRGGDVVMEGGKDGGGAQGLTGRPGRMDVCEEGEEQTQQDGRLSWGCRLILQAGCRRVDQTGGWSSEA